VLREFQATKNCTGVRMKAIKTILIWLIIGLLLGLWFGINIGREEPFYSNPFDAPAIQDRLKETGEEVLEKSGDALEKTGKAIKEGIED
jgi:hypothetical protein